MLHQRRLPFFVSSRNRSRQPPHALTRSRGPPVSSVAAAWTIGQRSPSRSRGRDQVHAKPLGPVARSRVREGLRLVVAQARQRIRRWRCVGGDRREDREDPVPQGRRAFERRVRVAWVSTRMPNEFVGIRRPDHADPKRPRHEVLVASERLDIGLAAGWARTGCSRSPGRGCRRRSGARPRQFGQPSKRILVVDSPRAQGYSYHLQSDRW